MLEKNYEYLDFLEWGTQDSETGNLNGIRDDAPDWAKRHYEEWKARQNEMKKHGLMDKI